MNKEILLSRLDEEAEKIVKKEVLVNCFKKLEKGLANIPPNEPRVIMNANSLPELPFKKPAPCTSNNG